MPKADVRVFIDEIYIGAIDKMIEEGHGTNRSQVIRTIVQEWLREKGKVC